jgi:hypothetical protein
MYQPPEEMQVGRVDDGSFHFALLDEKLARPDSGPNHLRHSGPSPSP